MFALWNAAPTTKKITAPATPLYNVFGNRGCRYRKAALQNTAADKVAEYHPCNANNSRQQVTPCVEFRSAACAGCNLTNQPAHQTLDNQRKGGAQWL